MALSSEKIVIYTCVSGDYDDLAPSRAEVQIPHYCFTDGKPALGRPWVLRSIPYRTGGPAERNRFVKMHPHEIFPEFQISVYVDGNIQIVAGIEALVRQAMGSGSLALSQHPFRARAGDEAEECAAIGYDWRWRILSQMARYRRAGFLDSSGFYEANVIIRRHHAPEVRAMMDVWWREYLAGTRRDQLSLPFAAWSTGTRIVSLGASDIRDERSHFSLRIGHKRGVSLANRARGRLNRWLMRRIGHTRANQNK
jgi:hypothetical protein